MKHYITGPIVVGRMALRAQSLPPCLGKRYESVPLSFLAAAFIEAGSGLQHIRSAAAPRDPQYLGDITLEQDSRAKR